MRAAKIICACRQHALYRWSCILIGWPRVGVSAGAAVGRDTPESSSLGQDVG